MPYETKAKSTVAYQAAEWQSQGETVYPLCQREIKKRPIRLGCSCNKVGPCRGTCYQALG